MTSGPGRVSPAPERPIAAARASGAASTHARATAGDRTSEREHGERDRREREDGDGRIAGAGLPAERSVELAEVGGRTGRRPDTRILVLGERDRGRRDVRDRHEAGNPRGRRLEDAAVAPAHDGHRVARVVPARSGGRQRDVDRHCGRPGGQLDQRRAVRDTPKQRLPRLATDERGQRTLAADGRPVARRHETDGAAARILLRRERGHDDDGDRHRLGCPRERESPQADDAEPRQKGGHRR